jgi:hypothetical protein
VRLDPNFMMIPLDSNSKRAAAALHRAGLLRTEPGAGV